MVDLNYDPFQENIVILGMQGTGKTTIARDILASIPNIPRWIWSPQKPLINYAGFGTPVNSIKQLQKGAYIYSGEFSDYAFDQFCERAMLFSNIILVIDDIQERVSKQKIPKQFARLVNSGRNRGVCGIYLSPSPNLVNNIVLQSAQHIFAFKFNLETQIKWMADNYFGKDAWILLPPHLRKHKPLIANVGVLPDHSYLYRKHTDLENSIFYNGNMDDVAYAPEPEPEPEPELKTNTDIEKEDEKEDEKREEI